VLKIVSIIKAILVKKLDRRSVTFSSSITKTLSLISEFYHSVASQESSFYKSVYLSSKFSTSVVTGDKSQFYHVLSFQSRWQVE
jgi:hypothetical protein